MGMGSLNARSWGGGFLDEGGGCGLGKTRVYGLWTWQNCIDGKKVASLQEDTTGLDECMQDRTGQDR